MTTSGGVEGNLITNVPDAATLASLPTQSFRYYDLASVDALRSAQGGSLFFYDPAGTQTVDSVTVIATKNGTGRWLSFTIFGDTIALIVSNLAALAALDTTNFRSSTRVNVQTLRSAGFFTLDRSSTATPDGIRVVAAAGTGGGNWLRNLNVSRSWCYQTQWYVDPVGGNDENTGAAVGNALKTIAELTMRLQVMIQGFNYTIDLLGNVPSTDRLNWTPTFVSPGNTGGAQRGAILIRGQQTVVRSGTLTGATQTNSTTQATAVDAGVANWTADVGRLLAMTGGAQAGESCWIAKDLGANTARVGSWTNAGGFIVGVVPALSTYNIVTLTTWACDGAFSVAHNICSITFESIEFLSPNATTIILSVSGAAFFTTRCKWSPSTANSGLFSGTSIATNRSAWLNGGSDAAANIFGVAFGATTLTGVSFSAGSVISNTQIEVLADCRFRAQSDVLFQGTRLQVANSGIDTALSGSAYLGGNCGFFDWDRNAAANGRDAAISVEGQGFVGVAGFVFGSTAAANTYGVRVEAGGQMMIASQGGVAGVSVAGAAAAIRFDDPGVGAATGTATPPLVPGAVTPAVQPLTTWANWAAAPFNSYVMSYRNGARIYING